MKTKYLYVDDEQSNSIQPLVDRIKDKNHDLSITHMNPIGLESQISTIKSEKTDGLILDLRLDTQYGERGERVPYRATTLAQEIRTRATEGMMEDMPIVLLSIQQKMTKSFLYDQTSHDLFDAVYNKKDVPEGGATIANELIALAQGYKEIKQKKKVALHELLKLKKEQFSILDPRFISKGSYFPESKAPTHEFARRILELINVPGILIDEQILAARLGVDIKKSTDWSKLKAIVSDASSYKGPFNNFKNRWWAHLVEQWWLSYKNVPGPLRRLHAEGRVAFLKITTKHKGLVPAVPIMKNYRTQFWTVCQALNKPLDPIDGFVIEGADQLPPWQDKPYISIKAAIEKTGYTDGLKVHPLEIGRLESIKKTLKNAKN